ncbi:hypothetical protein B7486_45760 [cyanobacterium TDX16]|nr:hypothetical protein B7486_45760 [cyanobacterium TDX16]
MTNYTCPKCSSTARIGVGGGRFQCKSCKYYYRPSTAIHIDEEIKSVQTVEIEAVEVMPTEADEPEYGTIPWISFKVRRAESDLKDVAYYIWKESQAHGISFSAMVRQLRDQGASIPVADRTLSRRLEAIPEYAEHQEQKHLNPSAGAVRKRKYDEKKRYFGHFDKSNASIPGDCEQAERTKIRDIPHSEECPLQNLTSVEQSDEPTTKETEEVAVDPKQIERVDKQTPGDIATLAKHLVSPKTQAQIKREEKKRKVALATIHADPLEIGYENARLKAENARLRDEIEKLKPVPIDVDGLGSREVKGLAQRLGLNQNLSTEGTRELVREALANRDNLIKARQLLGQTEIEVLQAKVVEQQELLELWQQSHQYYVGKGSFWEVLDASPNEPQDTIRAKYRRLIGFWHPDLNPLPVANEIAARINRAWASYERNYITRKTA